MSQETTTTTPESRADAIKEKTGSIVDAIFDVGTAWAEYGLNYGKFALESSAKALTRTAKALETLQEKIKAKADEKSAA